MARFLRNVFGMHDSPMFQAEVLRWKCLAPHPFWDGGRGYALRHKGGIAAFGCVVPCRFLAGPETVSSCNVIDWAASKTVPGAGVMLYRHIQGLAGTMINVGGTPDARQVLPRIGFEARTELHHYKRVLRPWRHFAAARMDWKSPLRLARDYRELARAMRARLSARRVETCAGLSLPDSRTAESLGYFQACPAATLETYAVDGGYFLLSRVGRQCRIADLWIRSVEASDWAEVYASAAALACADEITTGASGQLQIAALELAGYRRTHSEPVFVYDPASRLKGHGDLAVGFLENDAFYWSPTPASTRSK